MIKKGKKLRRMNRRKTFNEGRVIANSADGEGHTKSGGDECDVNDGDYWKINHVCQGNHPLAIRPPSTG